MAEDSWPKSTRNGGTITDYEHEQLVAPTQHSGLIGQPSDTTLVYADSTGLQVKVRALRYGMVRAKEWYSGPNETTKPIASNTSGATRYDLVVLRWDRATNGVTLEIRQGTPGQARPAPVQEAPPAKTFGTGIWELPIAQVAVANNAATIAAGDITYLAWYICPDGLILCTDTTRPYGATLYAGMEIYENNTGNKLRWTGVAWKRLEWDQAWGVIGGKRYMGTAALATGIAAGELYINMDTGPATLLPGRSHRWMVRVFATSNTAAIDYWIFRVRRTNVAGTQVAEQVIKTEQSNYGITFEFQADHPDIGANPITDTWVLTAQRITGGTSSLSIARSPVNSAYVLVEDKGPISRIIAAT